MSQASIILNVSDTPYSHSNGLSGIYTVPARQEGEEFGMLVIYPGREIQDIGEGRKEVHWPKARKIAEDILGRGSDATAHAPGTSGGTEKWGLWLCAAEPDLPKDFLGAIEDEIAFLNANPPDTKFRYDPINKINVAVNIEADSVKAEKVRLSDAIQERKAAFEKDCRKLVTKQEVAKAKQAQQIEDQRLIAEADRMWAQGETTRKDINERHQRSCQRMGQERPWCYTVKQLVDCPGCGASIKEDILACPHCAGFLDEGIEELRAMKPKERAVKMYPERYSEPVTAGATGQQRRG